MTPNDVTDSGFIEVETILYTLANLFSQAQQAIDRKSLDLARELLELDAVGFSFDANSMIPMSDKANNYPRTAALPLLSMVSYRRYRISELKIEFTVISEDDRADIPSGQTRLHVVPFDLRTEHIKPAHIKVINKEGAFAEFAIAGEIKATLALGGVPIAQPTA